ncbi:geranylgeranylglycerol-phosphate geranylgeranyltransferase [Halostella pelagica]|uniref:geranylgeranylglycerol-phosphate geranylgeranyltransferase n=1 Tax=Halostella pelagica TaxID=2583824 RepID=UPI0010821A99|nr:geranylgeranylglycerol-phosphate geranylgeranyltransferase [Halostella pelagica]
MSVGERVRGLVELTRPGNAVAAGALTFVGAFVAVGSGASSVQTLVAAGATTLAVGAGNALNDYFDREIDAINQPARPIPRDAVSPRGALVFSLALFAGAVVLAAALPPLAIGIAAVNLLALIAYTELFKGLPGVGNVVVGFLGGSTFLFGGAAVGRPRATVVLFVLAALSTVTREIIKDVEDIDGDREEGLNTLPIAIGAERALYVAAGFLALAVLASPVPYFLGTFGAAYLTVVGPADFIMVYAMVESFDDPTAGQSRIKYGMFLAAVAFVVGRLAM